MTASPTPLEDIAYLARSDNRVTTLDRLAEGSATRRELHDETGISQPTLGRVLDGFVERGWVTCHRTNGKEYGITPLGELVAASFEDLYDAVGTMQRLRPIADGLPLDRMDFDLRRLADAEVTLPTGADAMAHFRREDELVADADRVRFLCASAYAPSIETYRDRFVGGDQHLEAIITGEALDAAFANPDTAPLIREMAAADTVTVHRYEGPVSVMLGRIDDVASILPLDDDGVPRAFVESRDPVVRDWVDRELAAFEAEATPLEGPLDDELSPRD